MATEVPVVSRLGGGGAGIARSMVPEDFSFHGQIKGLITNSLAVFRFQLAN